MDLIQKAINLGFEPKNKDYYLWEIQKWLREISNIHIQIWFNSLTKEYRIDHVIKDDIEIEASELEYNTYEEALEIALQETLKFINEDRY